MIKFLNLILIALLFSSCDSILSSKETNTYFYSVKTMDSLRIELDITSNKIENLKDIKAQFKLKNISGKKIIYEFRSGCQFGFTILKNKKSIFDSRNNVACTASLTGFKLEPGQSKSFPIILEYFQINENLAKGMYGLKAFLLDNQGAEITTSFKVK